MTEPSTFTPQTDPLWVGMQHSGYAVSGRVVGWIDSPERAPFRAGSGLPNPAGTRARAVVLVHASNTPAGLLGPVADIDADWPARYVATAEEAWRVALALEAEWDTSMGLRRVPVSPEELASMLKAQR